MLILLTAMKVLKEYKCHEIKIVNFVDYITIFLRDIACLNRIQVILKLYEDTSSSKINFCRTVWVGGYKNKTNQPEQVE